MDKNGERNLIVFIEDGLEATLSVAIFHALAEKNIECIVLTEAKGKCLSLGYFDNANEFVDFEYCNNNQIPITRRQTGGGTVLLHEGQIFYQFIFSKKNKNLPFKMENVYKYFSNIILEVYKEIGLKVEYKPLADIVFKDKKISGQGAGDINNMLVFVGNILMDFDYTTMANVISYIKDKYSFEKLLREHITTLKIENINITKKQILDAFIKTLKKYFNTIEIMTIPKDILERARVIEKELTKEEVIKENTGKSHNTFKIKEGFFINPANLQQINHLFDN